MSGKYILVHDLGTTGDKACLFNEKGELVVSQYHRYSSYHRHPYWVEQRPEEWWQAVRSTTPVVLEKAGIFPSDVAGVTWSGHMLGCIPVDKNGNLLQEYVMIYADSRARKEAEYFLNKLGGWEAFYDITAFGHEIEHHQVPKILWIKKHAPEVYNKTDKFLTTKDYLTMVLTGEKVCDYTDTFGLLDLKRDVWSNEILEAAGIGLDKLPELHESTDIAGYVQEGVAEEMGLKKGIPVVVGSADSLSAGIGAGLVEKNDSFINISSACELGYLTENPTFNPESQVSCYRHVIPGKYLVADCMWDGGISIDWLKDMFFRGGRTEKDEEKRYIAIERGAKRVPLGSEGVLFLPYLRGGGAPYHDLNIKGSFSGLTLLHTRDHLARAVYEGIALNARATCEVFENSGAELSDIRMIGGGALSAFWRQVFADVMGKNILRPELVHEASSLGSAVVGGIGIGLFKDFSVINEVIKIRDINKPQTEAHAKYEKIYKVFKDTYNKLKPIYDNMSSISH